MMSGDNYDWLRYVVPAAIGLLDPALRARLSIVQQARDEDLKRVRDAYDRVSVQAELEPFFSDLPARMAAIAGVGMARLPRPICRA